MKLVIGNFKMNLNSMEIDDYIDFFKNEKCQNTIFAPSNIYLTRFITNGFKVASQDVSMFDNGAHTGDISASQLKSIGVNYSIVGHSERRSSYHENELISEKMKRLLENGIIPILCIGESKEERDNSQKESVLRQEIDDSFKNNDLNLLNNVIIAYEPIWSISTSGVGVVPSNDEITKTIDFIKKYLKDKYSLSLRVLYGGSVNNSCIDTLERISNVDGYLVGGCSIKKESFFELIKKVG